MNHPDITHKVRDLTGAFAVFRDRIKPTTPEHEVQVLRAFTIERIAKLQIDYELVVQRLNRVGVK